MYTVLLFSICGVAFVKKFKLYLIMEQCNDCKASDFVEYHGDLTCRQCGLVRYERMVEDRVEFMPKDLCHEREVGILGEEIRERRLNKVQRILERQEDRGKVFARKLMKNLPFESTIQKFALELIQIVIDKRAELFKGSKKRCIVGICLYCASVYLNRGISIYKVSKVIGVEHIMIWKVLPDLMPIWKDEKWYNMMNEKMASNQKKSICTKSS
jgi:transcription initiation factor TFIIIB Brf1 subunit/transcription initiation factor TFIIB